MKLILLNASEVFQILCWSEVGKETRRTVQILKVYCDTETKGTALH